MGTGTAAMPGYASYAHTRGWRDWLLRGWGHQDGQGLAQLEQMGDHPLAASTLLKASACRRGQSTASHAGSGAGRADQWEAQY